MANNSIDNLHSFAIHTLGCKVNTYESQSMINQLTSCGLVQVDFNQPADIYIINTCSVTNNADVKSRNVIAKARKLSADAIIIVAGCYSQIAYDEIASKLKVDIVIGNKYKNDLVSLINKYLKEANKIIKVDNLLLEKDYENLVESSFSDRTRAFLKIQDGCNFMCSYCIIPFARGKQRSKKMSLIINEIQDFVQRGFKEIVLSGVNTAGYLDNEGHNFYDLLKAINTLEGDFRIRISSLEPFQISDEIIELITHNQERFCSHWHICLQSGSDHVLKAMHRKYSIEEFKTLVKKIRVNDPLVSISTDYIAGFPTESETDHNESLQHVQEIGFSFMHVFTYSKRKNTAAANMVDIHGAIKKRRTNEAIKLSNAMYHAYLKQFIGKEVKVLFEKEQDGVYVGKASQYFEVLYKSSQPIDMNAFHILKVDKVIGNTCILKDK